MVRRKLSAVLTMTLCLLLASCGLVKNTIGDAMDFRERLRNAGGCSFTAHVFSEIGEKGYEFALSTEYTVEGTAELTVLAPDSIAGIGATVTDLDAELSFDGVALDFGVMDPVATSPLYGPFLFGTCWDAAYIDCGGNDGDWYRVTYRLGYEEDELILETWFLDGVPARCELYRGQTMLLSAEIEGFTFLS